MACVAQAAQCGRSLCHLRFARRAWPGNRSLRFSDWPMGSKTVVARMKRVVVYSRAYAGLF